MKRWLLYGSIISPKKKDVAKLLKSPHLLLLIFLNLFSLFVFAQQRVTGRVTSGNAPVVGATVTVKNTTTATTTNESGDFSITAPANSTLVVSSVGFSTLEVKVGNNTTLAVEMQSSDQTIESVVVVGYGTQKKATMTGSVSTITGTELTKSPAPNVTSSLQGRLTGLTANQRGGQPGRDDPQILIRGTGSVPPPGANFQDLLNLNAPLVVIDGVPRDNIGRLNPQDIESISVLKDGSAAIYGARAANGVILVTTKTGTKGKADFNFSYNYATNRPTKVTDVLDAATFAEVYNEGGYYRTRRNANEIGNPAYWIGPGTPQYKPDQIQKMRDGSDPNLNPNTDWVGLTLRDSYLKNMNLSVNGGSDKVRYFLSFGSLQQDGNFYRSSMLYKQYNMRAKVDIELVKNFNVGANISAIIKDGDYPGGGGGNSGNIDWFNILGANPTIVGVYPNGLYGPGRLGLNPLLNDDRGYNRVSDNPLFSTFTASYNVPFIKGLKFDGSFNYDMRNQFTKSWEIPYSFYDYSSTTQTYIKRQGSNPLAAQLSDRYDKWTTMLTNVRATYDKVFLTDHHIAAMLGWEQQQNKFSFARAFRKNFLSPAIDQLDQGSVAAADQETGGSANVTGNNNYFGRINYDFKSKYLLEFLFRYDGSEIFPEDNRYGFFPGVSAGWRLSEEDFFQNALPFVNQLKLRASYSEVGSNRISAYNYLQSFFIGQNGNTNPNYVFGTADAPGIFSSLLANPNVTWERAKKTDLGLEAQLWNGKLGIDFTYWRQKRDNILYRRQLSVPATFGFPTLPFENIGKVNSHGVELMLTTRGDITKDLNYRVSGNVSYNTSKAVFLDEVPPKFAYQNQTGMPVFTDLYYKADGIFNTMEELNSSVRTPNTNQRVGDIKIVDLNKDGVINGDDRYRTKHTSIPKYVFGLNSDFQFKGFDLNIFFQGQAGVRNYDGNAASLGNTDFTNAAVWRATNRWTEANPNGTMPRSDTYQPGNTDFFLFDASFVRLKTVELGYNLPQSLLQKTRFVKNLRLYVSGFNVATWAKDISWADPELNGGYFTYPPLRTINFGASLKF